MDKDIEYAKLDKSAKSCMRINAVILGVIIAAAVLITLFIIGIKEVPAWLWIVAGALLVMMAVYIIVSPGVRYERYRYAIDDEAIRVREGFIWINYSIVPIERLHKIQLSQGPIARIFKLSTVCVTTAGGDVDIKFIKEEVANEIAENLREVINKIAVEEREG